MSTPAHAALDGPRAFCRDCLGDLDIRVRRCGACGSPRLVRHPPVHRAVIGRDEDEVLPDGVAYSLTRRKNVVMQQWLYQRTRTQPAKVKQYLLDKVRKELPDVDVDTHFTPPYNPWEQRLCLVPDGDMFKAIREGHAFADTVFGGKPAKVDYDLVPSAVFSQPPIGAVGLTEAQAREQYEDVQVFRSDFRPMKNVLAPYAMILKIVVLTPISSLLSRLFWRDLASFSSSR